MEECEDQFAMRLARLHRRLDGAELRIKALTSTLLVLEPVTGQGSVLPDIESLITATFQELADRYAPVRKYLKTISKDLRKYWLHPKRKSGDNAFGSYWVVRAVKQHGTILGCIGVRPAYGKPHVAEISNLCVSSSYRRLGLGRRLLNHVLLEGAAHEFQEFHASVLQDSIVAIALYKSMGFEDISHSSMGDGCCALVHMIYNSNNLNNK